MSLQRSRGFLHSSNEPPWPQGEPPLLQGKPTLHWHRNPRKKSYFSDAELIFLYGINTHPCKSEILISMAKLLPLSNGIRNKKTYEIYKISSTCFHDSNEASFSNYSHTIGKALPCAQASFLRFLFGLWPRQKWSCQKILQHSLVWP